MLIDNQFVATLRYKSVGGMFIHEQVTPESLNRFLNAKDFTGGEMRPHNWESPMYVVDRGGELFKYYGSRSLLTEFQSSIELLNRIKPIK